MIGRLGMLNTGHLGRVLPRVASPNRRLLHRAVGRRWVSISSAPTGDIPPLDTLPSSSNTSPNADSPDAKFEVLGAPYSLLSASVSASQPLYTRRGTLVGLSGKADNVVSNLSLLEPFRRAIFGIPFLYQKVNAASHISALIATKSPFTSFTTIYLDGTLDWMISQKDALLAWTGQTLVLSPRINAKLSLAHWGNTLVTGRGLVALSGKGQIYQLILKADEQYVAHPSNVLAYTVNKHPPLPYRFKSTALRLEVPGLGGLWRFLPDVKFFRSMRESSGWKFLLSILFTLRTWLRRTVWGDRLFVQFHGPATILLQTRAARISDILTSRDVNEIADTEPGAIQSAMSAVPQAPQEVELARHEVPRTVTPTKMTVASVGKGGEVNFEKKA